MTAIMKQGCDLSPRKLFEYPLMLLAVDIRSAKRSRYALAYVHNTVRYLYRCSMDRSQLEQ